MRQLIKPNKLHEGDTIATISISGGRAGDSDLVWRYKLGKKRLEDVFGLKVIETPNALKGTDFLYKNPQKRAEDLMWALKNPDVKGIICNMGGDDSARLLPYIDFDVIRDNPKVFMGYSDITTLTIYFAYAGVMSYYGPNVLTPIAQPVCLDSYTEKAIRKTLFSNEIIGEVLPCDKYTKIEWQDKKLDEIEWVTNTGYELIQGSGTMQGRLIGGCVGPLQQIMGTFVYPNEKEWEDSIIFLEWGLPYNSVLADLHQLRALNASGVFQSAKGLITTKLNFEEKEMLLKFLKYEAQREDMPVLANVDFMHRTPMTVLPIGAMAEINCDKKTFSILESGVI